MQESHPLRTILEDAARGRFPPTNGDVRVLPAPPGRSDAVIAFTAHHIVAADVEPHEVLAQLPPADFCAPMRAGFLTWLGRHLGSPPGSLDVVLAAPGLPGRAGPPLLREAGPMIHERLSRAERCRDDVSAYSDPDGSAVVVFGDGLAGRHEVSLEVEEAARGLGYGRRLLLAARALIAEEEWIFAQVAPGNAASLRAFLAAGFTPIGSEVLFLRDTPDRTVAGARDAL